MKKIVITGGPSTGKTSIITEIEANGYACMPEISRQITLDARNSGIEHLFLTDPILFSIKLLDGRTQQFKDAENLQKNIVFFDRGIPDVLAYLNGTETDNKQHFVDASSKYKYDIVFILPPWKEIHTQDNERYEDFDEAQRIHGLLEKTYTELGYAPIDVPIGTIADRTQFILNAIKIH